MGKDERNSYTIKTDDNLGEVQIADEVVAIIAGLAAMEVEGVASMAGNVQEKVKASIENMTGLTVADVNIRVAGVDMEN